MTPKQIADGIDHPGHGVSALSTFVSTASGDLDDFHALERSTLLRKAAAYASHGAMYEAQHALVDALLLFSDLGQYVKVICRTDPDAPRAAEVLRSLDITRLVDAWALPYIDHGPGLTREDRANLRTIREVVHARFD